MDQHQLDEIAARIASATAQFSPSYRPSPRQRADAAAVLRDMLQAAAQHGVTFGEFDAVADFPRMALQLVQTRDNR